MKFYGVHVKTYDAHAKILRRAAWNFKFRGAVDLKFRPFT
ncbi:hypothetical protein CAMGR0001_2578 [Campylobacter gracilis RM3268]|uniref:Uncharacterized protein n=1 Tax=Campylobacter gracilis RM3268 TaxID=553220 RepID=C8PET9_9BACT|nr:hypothetical protein CAMGR0001_2578 [Campylobacter gracilis RM3268]